MLTGGATNAVPFTATADDPSAADRNAGFSWEWAVDGQSFSPGPNPLSTTFATCGEHALSARAADKDGQVSEPLTSGVVSVHEAHYE